MRTSIILLSFAVLNFLPLASAEGRDAKRPEGPRPAKISAETEAKVQKILDEVAQNSHTDRYLIPPRTPAAINEWMQSRQQSQRESGLKRDAAEAQLIGFGPSITPILVRHLSSSSSDVAAVCSAVVGHFGLQSVPFLIQELKTSGSSPHMASAFRRIGIDSMAPLLELAHSADADARAAAIETLAKLIGRPGSGRFVHVEMTRTDNDFALSTDDIRYLASMQMTEKRPSARKAIASLLAGVGPRIPLVSETLRNCAEKDPEPGVRTSAIAALSAVAALDKPDQADASVKTLCNILAHDDFEGCRAEAAIALAQQKRFDLVASRALLSAMADPYPRVSGAASQSLIALTRDSAAAQDVIYGPLTAHPITRSDIPLINILRQMPPSARRKDILLPCLKNSDSEVQVAALNALNIRRENISEYMPTLIELLNSDNSSVRHSVISILSQAGANAEPALPALRALLSKANQFDKHTIENAIKRIEKPNP